MSRTTLITGATGAIGAATAHHLAAHGDHLVLVARNPTRAATLADGLRHRTTVEVEVADLSLSSETRSLAARLLDDGRPIDTVVHAAGTMSPRRVETPEGHDTVMMLQFVTRYLLTEQLRPVFGARSPARVVTVSGGYRTMRRFDPDNLDGRRRYRGMARLSEAGHANALWTHHINATAASPYQLVDVHPGLVRSALGAEMSSPFRALMHLAMPIIGTPVDIAGANIARATTEAVGPGFLDAKGRTRAIAERATHVSAWTALRARTNALIDDRPTTRSPR